MVGEYNFMLPEDRAQKRAEFERERRDWISIRSRGAARFLLLHGILRQVIFILVWGSLDVIFWHVRLALVLRAIILVLLMGPLLNLFEWHWNERRYRGRNL